MGRAALFLVFSIPAALCAGWTIFAGKDVNWDLLNYHYYAPFALLAGRLEQDFFAASAQSYLNPVGYLPFYLMVSAGWHSVAVSMALAAAHSLFIGFLYLISWKLLAHRGTRQRILLSCLAAALGGATAVYWATVGTSFLDPLLAVPMLTGLLLLLADDPASSVRHAFLAGILFGGAAALKYSNAVFAIAALPLALAMPAASGAARLRAGLGYAAGGALALGVLAGPWFALLMREFGNPVFPLFNAWFQSPYAAPVNMVGERFRPQDLVAAAALPFRMVAPDRTLYAELIAPDLRFAALALVAAALPVMVAVRKRQAGAGAALQPADWRVLGFFCVALALWVATSANGRYGMLVLLLAGVCLARLADRLMPPAASRIALLVLLIAQIAACVLASSPRWSIAERWSRHWLPYDVPERAVREPALYLTVETLPMAVIAPFLHPASSLVNLRGQHSIAPGSQALATLLASHGERVRTLGRTLQLQDDGRPRAEVVKAFDNTFLRFGYRVDADDCFAMAWHPDEDDWLSRTANRLAGEPRPWSSTLSMASCALRPARRDPRDIAEERRISRLFDVIEKGCPGLFRGQTALTEPLGSEWSRSYNGLDAPLETLHGRVILHTYLALTYFYFGPLSACERGDAVVSPVCR